MPTYEYHCATCEATYELRQGFDADTTHTCEECGRGTAKRVLHAPPIVFKGSGWYVTDSRSHNPAIGETKAEGDAKTESSPTSDSGSSAAPEASAAS